MCLSSRVEVLFKGAVVGAVWPERWPLPEAGLRSSPGPCAEVSRGGHPEPPCHFGDTLISQALACRRCSRCSELAGLV